MFVRAAPQIRSLDARRDIALPGTENATQEFMMHYFVDAARHAIRERGRFIVMLPGGATPQPLFRMMGKAPWCDSIDWSRVWIFWGDERQVPFDHPDSNYGSAMRNGLELLPIAKEHLFPMHTDDPLERRAEEYEAMIRTHVPDLACDLILLGVGDDGHIASLFPKTHALDVEDRLVMPNYVPEKKVWRLTITYPCLARARCVVLYVTGVRKKEIASRCLNGELDAHLFPAQAVGTEHRKALWVLDDAAAELLINPHVA